MNSEEREGEKNDKMSEVFIQNMKPYLLDQRPQQQKTELAPT